MGFIWTNLTPGVTTVADSHHDEIRDNIDIALAAIDDSWSWNSGEISGQGEDIFGVDVGEMRDAADYLDDQNYCRVHKATHDITHDGSYDAGILSIDLSDHNDTNYDDHYDGNKSVHDVTINVTDDSGQDSGYDGTNHGTWNNDECPGYDSNLKVTYYNNQHSSHLDNYKATDNSANRSLL